MGPGEVEILAAIAYNDDWRQLYLCFGSGDIYWYRGAPVEGHTELLAADSKGEYALSHISIVTRMSEFVLAGRTASDRKSDRLKGEWWRNVSVENAVLAPAYARLTR